MIETKEQYDRIVNEAGHVIVGVLELRVKDLTETIEALRDVARAAKRHAAKGYANSQPDWRYVVLEKLDALPDWLLE